MVEKETVLHRLKCLRCCALYAQVRCCFTDAERITHQPRDLFTNALLDDAAANGRWLGTYDVPLSCNGRVETPMFKLPHRSAARIHDFVRQMVGRGYSSLCGMMGWAFAADRICGFNIAALAEWSWNADGRSPNEFSEAWALRSGMDAEAAAQFVAWQSVVGPIGWDVMDSQFPTSWNCPWCKCRPLHDPAAQPPDSDHLRLDIYI